MKAKKKDKNPQGVPRETPDNNTLAILERELAKAIGIQKAYAFIHELVSTGYFNEKLSTQRTIIKRKLLTLSNPEEIMKQLEKSTNDKIRSLAPAICLDVYDDKLKEALTYLYRAGALPGTWTQETAQTVLKNAIHKYGLEPVLSLTAKWSTDAKPEVRRMLIEGLRPCGVWCKHIDELKADPKPIKALLENLLDDKSLYVRKAVANSLNDISKDNPELLCHWVKSWLKGTIGAERKWIIERGLRTLIKEAYPPAMRLLGYTNPGRIKLIWKKGTPRIIKINQRIPFEFEITNRDGKTANVRLQLEMHGPGKGNKPRVARYLLGNLRLGVGEKRTLRKEILFAHKNSVPKLKGVYTHHIYFNGSLIGKRQSRYE